MGTKRMNSAGQAARRERGQSMTEMALVLPVLLLLLFGVFEMGRVIFIYNAIINAGRETARFGAATGLSGGGTPNYLDCAALRQTARETAFLAGLVDGDIQISYDTPVTGTMSTFANCGDTGLNPGAIKQGDRILVTINKVVEPIIPLVGLPDYPISFTAGRTILKDIIVGPVECSDGVDNDGDGFTDWDGGGGTPDPGCSGPDDTTEAFCYRLTVINSPPEGGSLSILPDPNCANRYIEQTYITLGATPAEDFKFIRWSGSITTTANPAQFYMDADKDVVAEFKRLESDLVVTKSASPKPVHSRNPLTYTISVTNQGPDLARSVAITDTLPPGLQLQSWSINAGNCPTATSTEFNCTVPQILVGSSVSLTISVLAPVADLSTSTITNTVTASAREVDPILGNNTFTATVQLLPRAELSVTKADSVDPVVAGTKFEYTFVVSNAGPDGATGVALSDFLPSAIEPDVGSLPAGCTYTSSTRKVACTLGNIAAGAAVTRTITVDPRGNGRVVNNIVTVTGNEYENVTADNSASQTTTILSHADLEIKTNAPSGVDRDVPFEYVLDVSNKGPSEAANVQIVNTLPVGMQYNSFTSTKPGTACSGSGRTITCTLGTILDSASFQVRLNVTPTAEGEFTNTTSVSSGTPDNKTGNNSSSATTTVTENVALSITVTSTPSKVKENDNFAYTIDARNNGTSIAYGVSVVDTLPAGVSFVSAAAPFGWSCDATALPVVTCTPASGSLPAGGQAIITLQVTAKKTGTLTNNVSITSSEDSASASVATTVDPTLDLVMGLSTPVTGTVGVTFSYVLTVTNSGPSTATGVVVTSALDPTVQFTGAVVTYGSGWTCSYDSDDHEVTCTRPTMGGNTGAGFAIYVTPTVATEVIVEGMVAANESGFETSIVNNYASGRTTINGSAATSSKPN